MEYEIAQKEKKLNGIIDDLTRKSNLNDEELLFLKDEIDKERRKSLADDQKIKKLQGIISQNAKQTGIQIRQLAEELEAERRKSMMDEKRAQDLERTLNEKIYFLNELTRRKSDDEREIKFLQDEIDKQRNKSMKDEATIQKLEEILR